ncbi:MAG: hypothetical protein ACO1OG_05205 [Devosia sp.]
MHRWTPARELGTALAVLAIYVLTLLSPLHQSAGTQRELAKLGFETIGQWSLCSETPQKTGDRGDTPVPLKCPAAGGSKLDFTVPAHPTAAHPPVASMQVAWRIPAEAGHLLPGVHRPQSRAPPSAA